MDERKMITKTLRPDVMHNIILENRKKLSVSGVSDVESFNEEEIVLHTEMGVLIIKGASLHIGKLNMDNGEVSIDGAVDTCEYADDKSRDGGGLLAKIFK